MTSIKKLKILDCTLRDGGYYTNWDFESEVTESYIDGMNVLPIDYVEVGYRNNKSPEYLGKFGYSPVSVLKKLREHCSKKLCVMLNEKSTAPSDLQYLLEPITGLVDMIRIAIDPKNFDRAIVLATEVKKMGFEVGFNTMYMSKWKDYDGFLNKLHSINDIANLFCMVDSFGGVTPDNIKEITRMVKQRVTCPIGFHGHNNMQLGLINTLTAIDEGVDFVDATILGMGRGAGNLNMELLLTYLAKNGLDVDFNVLSDVITVFQPLYEKYHWGTNLPYMLSGANSIPQKEVMSWVMNRAYSLNSIVRALDNQRNHRVDNARYPILQAEKNDKVLIVGGGQSVNEHREAIKEFLKINPDIEIVFATARYANMFKDVKNKKTYCLVGNEAKRMKQNLIKESFSGICVLPPYPRTMGTEVPDYACTCTFELPNVTFTKSFVDSCTTVTLEIAIKSNAKEVYLVGYDGYRGEVLSEKEAELSFENRTLFDDFKTFTGLRLLSLTPTLYKSLTVKSIYQYL